MDGYIYLDRKMVNHWLWDTKPYDKARAWIDLIFMMNYQDTKVAFNGQLIELKRGQRITSKRALAERWGWSTKKVTTFLDRLEMDGMLSIKSDNKKTLVTIENYDLYQTKETQKNRKRNAEETQKKTEKKSNKRKEIKDIYIEQAECLLDLYPNNNGKAVARKKLPSLIEEVGYDILEACVKSYAEECKGREKKFIKHASTFFNSGYKDYLKQPTEVPEVEYYYVEDPETGERIRKRVGE